MVLSSQNPSRLYADHFWAPTLDSAQGSEVLGKRNRESKRMTQDLEDYLTKRAKLESEYHKSLANLNKCFRAREEIGVLESVLAGLRGELLVMATAHQTASEAWARRAEAVRQFREDQVAKRKHADETLSKATNAKISNLNKALQAQKSYVKKSVERDQAELALKVFNGQQGKEKDFERLKSKCSKSEEEAQKADTLYKSAVMVLNNSIEQWEKEMSNTCQTIQALDEVRIATLRREIWHTVNLDSQLALDIDTRCEVLRETLEKCDITTEIEAFINHAGVGTQKPSHMEYVHYSRLTEAEATPRLYDAIDEDAVTPTATAAAAPPPSPHAHHAHGADGKGKMFGTLGRRLLRKSASDN